MDLALFIMSILGWGLTPTSHGGDKTYWSYHTHITHAHPHIEYGVAGGGGGWREGTPEREIKNKTHITGKGALSSTGCEKKGLDSVGNLKAERVGNLTICLSHLLRLI